MTALKRSTRPEAIRAFREQVGGLSQEAIARLLDVSLNTAQRYEQRGAPEAFRYTMAGLALELGYDPWKLGLLRKRTAEPEE